VISFMVTRRTREIAIRMALGAPRSAIFVLVLWGGLKVVLSGVEVGTVSALRLSRVLRHMLADWQTCLLPTPSPSQSIRHRYWDSVARVIGASAAGSRSTSGKRRACGVKPITAYFSISVRFG
jgi:predicted lysophospholipase L1 biosynthesis ABC-type transport system permease subunit